MPKATGGEPITVNAVIASGLLTAVEELYRNRNKKLKKGGNAELNKAHDLLLDPSNPAERWASAGAQDGGAKKKKNQKGGDPGGGVTHDFSGSRGNTPLPIDGGYTILMSPEGQMQLGGKNKKQNKKTGGDLVMPENSSATMMSETSQMGGKNKKQNKKTGGDLLMPENASSTMMSETDQMGGKNKNKKNEKKGGDPSVGITHDFAAGRSEHASVDAPLTILMPEMPQKGGKNKKDKKGGNHPDGVSHDFAGNHGVAIMGGKKNKKEGGSNSVGCTLYPPIDTARYTLGMGGNGKKEKKGKRGGKVLTAEDGTKYDINDADLPPPMQSDTPTEEEPIEETPVPSAEETPAQVGGKKKKNSKKDKLFIGGLAELNNTLQKLSQLVN